MEMFERIRQLRKEELHLSQEEFGKQLGVSRSVIANIELNVLARPEQKDPLIRLICKTFNVNEEWLRTGNGDIFVPRTRNQTITDFLGDVIKDDDSFKKRFIEALAALDIEDWEYLEKLVIKLTKKD